MLAERRHAEELMDDPALDAEAYARVLADLAQVNTVTLARRPTLSFLKRAIKDRTSFSVLDVGFGDGDTLRAIARWAKRERKQARLVGIDLNSRSEQIARDATSPELNIDFRTGDYAKLEGRQFDFVISSLVAHHMSHQTGYDEVELPTIEIGVVAGAKINIQL